MSCQTLKRTLRLLTKLVICDIYFLGTEASILISTVTISTITTITSMAAMGLSATIGIVAVVALIAFLTTKEIVSATNSVSLQCVAKFLSIGILPLVIVFAVIVVVKITEVLA